MEAARLSEAQSTRECQRKQLRSTSANNYGVPAQTITEYQRWGTKYQRKRPALGSSAGIIVHALLWRFCSFCGSFAASVALLQLL